MRHRCFFVHGPTSRSSHSFYNSTEAAIAGHLNEAEQEAPIGNVQIVPYGAGLYVYFTQQEAKDLSFSKYDYARANGILRTIPVGGVESVVD